MRRVPKTPYIKKERLSLASDGNDGFGEVLKVGI